MQIKKILILGSSGVLGYAFKDKSFIKKFKNQYKFIYLTSKEVDLRNQKKTIEFIKNIKPFGILHLAGSGGGIGRSYNKHASILRDNVYMTFNVLEGARLAKTKKIILTMSTGMYPKKARIPLQEKDIHNGEPVNYNYGNSFGKRIIEPAVRAYRDQYNLKAIGVIVSGIFGEGDNFNYQEANMLPATIRKIIEAKKKNLKKVEVWGTGKPLREYTYSKDLRDIYMYLLKKYDRSLSFNVSSLQEKSISNIIKIICENVGYDFKRIYFNPKKPEGIFKKTPSIKIFNSIIKFKFTNLEEGIGNTVKWYNNSKKINLKSKEKKFII